MFKMSVRIFQGDCREVMQEFFADERFDSIITSPPYWKQRVYPNPNAIGNGTIEEYIQDLTEVFTECYRVLKPTGTFFLNIDKGYRVDGFLEFSPWEIVPILKDIGFKLAYTIIWYDITKIPITSPKILKHNFEPVFLLCKSRDYTHNKDDIRVPYRQEKDWGERTWKRHPKGAMRGDVWEIIHYRGNMAGKGAKWDRSHIAPFPVELVELLVTLGSNEGDIILDPFVGSGTVLEVARKLNRESMGIEIVGEYFDKIKERMQDKTLDSWH
jgi:site-specific DNA-methyltransferase (adenine-specific)